MSFYGEVKFDHRRFGDDDVLKQKRPLQYCIKMCHVIGFYLQKAHAYDLMKMQVDFHQDEFGEIWLMQVDKLVVRKTRFVPTENKAQIADFVLKCMHEEA